jgi:hypothetical protein
MIKWKARYVRLAFALGAIASFAVASGAGMKWGY